MDTRLSWRGGLRPALILLLLLVLILAPRLLSGILALREAEAESDPLRAAEAYRAAAERLPWRGDLYERAGRTYFQAGDYARAEAMYRRALERGGLSADGWLRLGQAAYAGGCGACAVETWEQALLRPDVPPEVQAYLAEAYAARGDFPAAIAAWQAYLARAPGDGWAHYRLGLLLAAQDPARALPELMQAAGFDPGLEATVLGLRTALNTALLEGRRSGQLLVAGQALAALDEWPLAGQAFAGAVADQDGLAEAWAWLAEARQQSGRDGQREIERALALDPLSAVVQGFYGQWLQRSGQRDLALQAFQQAAALDPVSAAWQLALAGAYEQDGDLVSSYGHLLLAVGMEPGQAGPWRALAEFCLRNGVHLEEAGRPAAERLFELAPGDWRALVAAGRVLLETGDPQGAEELLKQAAALDPTQAAPALYLGLLYLETGQYQLAQAYLVQAQAFDPTGPHGWQAGRLLELYFP